MNRRRKTRATTGPSYRERYDALRKKQYLTGQEQEELLQMESTPCTPGTAGQGREEHLWAVAGENRMEARFSSLQQPGCAAQTHRA